MSNWYNSQKIGSVAVSTRVRLARNIVGLPFPSKMTDDQRKCLRDTVEEAVKNSNSPLSKKLKFINMSDVSANEAIAMTERHIISPNFAASSKIRALLISEDESLSIMIGEEDHLRIQVLLAGFEVEEAYKKADEIDNFLSDVLEFAFDERLGYLTECPTNLGIGLRASVMLHLPILESNGELNHIIESASKIGLSVRGLYGEGSSSAASLYQLSNQITLGITEENAIDNLKIIANQIINKECAERSGLNQLKTADLCYRAYGILANARAMTSDEMLRLLSRVKLGIDMGIIQNVDATLPLKLIVECMPSMIQKKLGEMTPDDRDIARADIIRAALNRE